MLWWLAPLPHNKNRGLSVWSWNVLPMGSLRGSLTSFFLADGSKIDLQRACEYECEYGWLFCDLSKDVPASRPVTAEIG